jgi:hypothetical protein
MGPTSAIICVVTRARPSLTVSLHSLDHNGNTRSPVFFSSTLCVHQSSRKEGYPTNFLTVFALSALF